MEYDTIYRNVSSLNYHYNFSKLNTEVTEKNDATCITFNVCRMKNIPLLYTKININESFMDVIDFHSIQYTNQLVGYNIHYIWILFKWVKIKETTDLNNEIYEENLKKEITN